MGQLADRIAALQLPLNAPQSVADELAAIAARAEAIELDNESLTAINARVEAENDLLRDVAQAAHDNVPQFKCAELDDTLDALELWREANGVDGNERNHVDAASARHEVPHG